MVQTPFHTALVPAIGVTVSRESDLHAASRAAIALSAIAAHANPEHRLATATEPFPESDLARNLHAATTALDNRPDLWQGKTSFRLATCFRVAQGNPAVDPAGFRTAFPLDHTLRPPVPKQRKKNIPCCNKELRAITRILHIGRITVTKSGDLFFLSFQIFNQFRTLKSQCLPLILKLGDKPRACLLFL
jgi:hypothetical protein